MTYDEMIKNARGKVGPFCKACNVCDGKACGNSIPGPGSKMPGNVALRNYTKWQEITLNMDTLVPNVDVKCDFEIFGKEFKMPVFVAPIGGMNLHYDKELYNDKIYNDTILKAASEYGVLAFVGDNADPVVFKTSIEKISEINGMGVPTIKPWNKEAVFDRFDSSLETGAFAVAMDIDGAGLPFLKALNPNAGRKSVEELKEITDKSPVPFILKGVMTTKGAIKAVESGCDAIIVSNHGGRVLAGTPATCEVLEDIVSVVKGKCKIFVDGGIRSGVDVFRALALGADGVLIGRPLVTAFCGGREDGIKFYLDKIRNELIDTMTMCGASSLENISRDMVNL